MRVIWLSHFIPFPPRGGNLQRSFHLIRQISGSFNIALVAFNFLGHPREEVQEYAAALKQYCESIEIWELPHPWKGPRWSAEVLASPFVRDPISCRSLYSDQLFMRWKSKLANSPGALLHIDSIDLGMFAKNISGFRKVLNHHNCESALAFRRSQKESNLLKRAYLSLEARKLARLEESICKEFDVNTVVSEQDVLLLRKRCPIANFQVVENGVDITYFKPTAEEEEPQSLIFTGSLDWEPNISAIRFFVSEIWPQVRDKCHGARLYLAGRKPPASVERLAKADSGIVVISSPEDMRPLLARAAVYVCPILEGGGTRLKILDAMAMAKPVVSTTIGCEGLRVRPGENIWLADSASDFANKVLQLLANKALREQIGAAARRLVEKEYEWEKIGRQLLDAYHYALEPGVRNYSKVLS